MRSWWLLLAAAAGCATGRRVLGPAADLDTDYSGDTDIQVFLDVSDAGAWDDWDGPGGVVAFAVDEAAGSLVVLAVKFDLPFYDGEFEPLESVGDTIGSYFVAEPSRYLEDDIEDYPVLAALVTDREGVRSMAGDLTAIFAQGDLGAGVPERAWVADRGVAELTRGENADFFEVNLAFREIDPTALGTPAGPLDGGTDVWVRRFAFEAVPNLPCDPDQECAEYGDEACSDGVDNDHDMVTDCDDPDCDEWC